MKVGKPDSAGLNASFTEAAQREIQSVLALSSGSGKLKVIAVVGRAGVYEALALALFAGMVVLLSTRSCRSSRIDALALNSQRSASDRSQHATLSELLKRPQY